MNNILITGGTGFVGYWMQKTEPHNLSCDYISSKRYGESRWWNWKYDYIVHLAPISPTLVIKTARNYGARLLYASSGAVYHPENSNEYRLNKLKWESECLASGVDVVIARLFTFYGERLDEGKAYSQFVKAARENKTIVVNGDGKVVRSYMHGCEMGEWLWAILLRGECGEAYDVGSDEPITMLELAKFIKSQMKSKSEIVVKGGDSPVPYYMPTNTAKTKALLEKEKSHDNQ